MNEETRARLERGIAAGVVPRWVRIYESAGKYSHPIDEAPEDNEWLIAAVLLREVRKIWPTAWVGPDFNDDGSATREIFVHFSHDGGCEYCGEGEDEIERERRLGI